MNRNFEIIAVAAVVAVALFGAATSHAAPPASPIGVQLLTIPTGLVVPARPQHATKVQAQTVCAKRIYRPGLWAFLTQRRLARCRDDRP